MNVVRSAVLGYANRGEIGYLNKTFYLEKKPCILQRINMLLEIYNLGWHTATVMLL